MSNIELYRPRAGGKNGEAEGKGPIELSNKQQNFPSVLANECLAIQPNIRRRKPTFAEVCLKLGFFIIQKNSAKSAKKVLNMTEYLKAREVAQQFRMSIRRVQELAKAGYFPGAIKPAGRILIPRVTVEKMKGETL